jgi:predicted secreted protein
MRAAYQVARIKRRGFAILAKIILACAPMVPAIIINVDWSGRTPVGWMLASVAGIVLAACFIEGFRIAPKLEMRLFLLVCGLFGCYVNMLVAMKNASTASEDDRNARQTRILAANQASSQSSQSSQRRSALVVIAGETPSVTYAAQIQEAINRDIRKWESTAHCTDVTAKASGTYCAEIASLEGKKSAAEEREKIDAAPTPIVEAPPSEDPFADRFPEFAAGFGIAIKRENATAHLNGVRSMWLEIMAAVGPMVILLICDIIGAGISLLPKLEPRQPKAKAETPILIQTPAIPIIVNPKDERAKGAAERAADLQRRHEAFVADEMEVYSGVSMRSAEPWQMWKRRCTMRGEDAGDQRSFSQRLAKNFQHDHNHGRPRFLNVRAKQRAPAVRLVQ